LLSIICYLNAGDPLMILCPYREQLDHLEK